MEGLERWNTLAKNTLRFVIEGFAREDQLSNCRALSRYPQPASHIFPSVGSGVASSTNRAEIANIDNKSRGVSSCEGSGLGEENAEPECGESWKDSW